MDEALEASRGHAMDLTHRQDLLEQVRDSKKAYLLVKHVRARSGLGGLGSGPEIP